MVRFLERLFPLHGFGLSEKHIAGVVAAPPARKSLHTQMGLQHSGPTAKTTTQEDEPLDRPVPRNCCAPWGRDMGLMRLIVG